jgi:hypothetical protein
MTGQIEAESAQFPKMIKKLPLFWQVFLLFIDLLQTIS